MAPKILLAELRALDRSIPDFSSFTPGSRVHHQWLAKAEALVRLADGPLGQGISTSLSYIGHTSQAIHDEAVAGAVGRFYRALAKIETSGIAEQGDQIFGPGAVYDFFRALSDLLSSAQQVAFIIDPYLDDEVFDAYLTSVSPAVCVRLLTGKGSANIKTAIARFTSQHGTQIEARLSALIHDRVLFVDDRSCWVLGQSIKDAAQKKPTYLAPLDPDTTGIKLRVYEDIWSKATPFY